MQYCALKNGQQQQFGSNSQRSQAAPHFIHDVKGDRQAVTANKVLHYRTANARVQPPQSAHFSLHNGAHPARKTLNGQTSAGPNQKGGGNANGYFLKICNGNLQSSSSNVQSGNPGFRTSYRYEVARQQDFHQNSATQSQPTRMTASTVYSQQDFHQNSATQSQPTRMTASTVYSQQDFHQNSATQSQPTTMTANTVYSQQDMSPYWKPAPVAHERRSNTSQNVCTSLLMSATPNSQTVYNQLCRQNGTQHGLFPSTPPTTSNMATSLSFRNTTAATNLSPNAQVLCNTNISQKTQQYPAQLSSSLSSGMDANNSPNLNSYNQSKASCFLTKTKEPPPYSDAVQQQVLRGNVSPVYLDQYTARPDPPSSYIGSTYGGHQCVGNTRMRPSNQNTQPVTSALPEKYNPDCIQGRPLHSGQSLTESPENAMSRAVHPVNVPSHQNSAQNVFCSNLTGDGNDRSMSDNAHLPINKTILNGILASLLFDTPPVLAEATSPQINKAQLSKAKSFEMQEMQSSVKQNDGSILLSPGHTGTRAVAVVQPLTLESYASAHTSFNTVTGESSSYPEKVCLPSVANPALVTSETVSQNSAQKSVVDIGIAKTTQKSVVSEAQVGPNSPKAKNKMETSPTAHVFELSSVPTTAWTAVDLANLIQEGEKTQMNLKPSTENSLTIKLLHLFWHSSYKEMLAAIKSGCHLDVIRKVKQLYKTHGASDSVILWQVKEGCMEQLKNCHVLKDDEVYSEAPYKSSWLNVNEQLNDVYSESDCQVDQTKTANHILAPILSDVPKKVVPGTELEPVNSGKEKLTYTAEASSTEMSSPNETELKPAYPGKEPQVCTVKAPLTKIASPNEAKLEPAYPGKETKALTIEAPPTQIASHVEMEFEPAYLDKETQASTVKAPSTQTASPYETDCADSSDDFYSFKIEVLPPEEAKRIFGQIQSSVDTVSEAEDVMSRSVEGDTDATLSKSKPAKGNIARVEHICCVTKWMELILGSDMPHLDKCKCKEEQSPKEITGRALDQEKNDDLCGISKDHPIMESNNPTKAEENVQQMTTSSRSKLIQIIDLTDSDIPHSSSDQEPKNIHLISNNTQSNIVLLCESEDEDLSNTETEIPKAVPDVCINMSEPGDECVQEDNKSDETEQLSSSVSSEKQPEEFYGHSSDVSIHMSGGSEPVHLAAPPMESKTQAQMSEKADLKTSFSHCVEHERKRKTLSSQENFFPLQKKSKKCKRKADRDSQRHLEVLSKHGKVSADVTQACPSLSNVRTVELVLFGSAQKEKCVLKGTRKSHVSSPESLSNEATRPPEVLSVTLGKESSEAVSREECSAKRLIYENWKRSFQLTNISHRNKLKTQQCPSTSSSGPSFKKGKLPVSTRRRASLGNVKHSRDLYKKKRSLSHEPKLGEKTKEYTVTLKQPAEHDGSNAKGERANVLRFSVLPNTFTFKDGSSGRKETTEPFSDKPDVEEEKKRSPDKAAKKAKGSWYPNEKKCTPLCSPPETPSLFHRFQKKYIEKTQTSMDQ